MKAIIKANNNEIEIEITTEQAESLGLVKKEKMTGWERVKQGETYCYIDEYGGIMEDWESGDNSDGGCYKVANYFSTLEKTMEVNKEQTLWRKMKRFADENNSKNFKTKNGERYSICFNGILNDWEIVVNYHNWVLCEVYFETEKIAEKALELFGEELKEVFLNENNGLKEL